MKTSLSIIAILLSINAMATDVQTKRILINTKGTLQVAKVIVEEACAQTVDPSWDHEEDTRATRLILSTKSYYQTKDQLEILRAQGYSLYGYANNEKCTIENYEFVSTYPLLKNPNPSNTIAEDYFYHMITSRTLAKYAEQQNAFKKVTRIYVKGIKQLKEKTQSELTQAIKSALE